jgi:hypothetical protein
MILWDTPTTGPCRVTDCTCTKFEQANPTVERGDVDLHQAIQAATTALCDQHPAIGLSDPWAQVARIAVEAAASVLLQAIRDRLADLEVQVAELRDLLEQANPRIGTLLAGDDHYALKARIETVLQVDGPARGHAILAEVQRLHALTAVEDVPAHPFVAEQRSNLCLLFVQGGRTCGKERDDPIHALDQAAQREGQ